MAVKTRKHVTVTLKDATGTPITKVLGPTPGDFQIQGLQENNTEGLPIYSRGSFLELVEGDDVQIQGSITVYHDGNLTGTSVADAILKAGNFASGVTQDPGGVVWTLDTVVTVTRGADTDTFTLSNCRFQFDYNEDKEGNKLPIKFTCYGGCALT